MAQRAPDWAPSVLYYGIGFFVVTKKIKRAVASPRRA